MATASLLCQKSIFGSLGYAWQIFSCSQFFLKKSLAQSSVRERGGVITAGEESKAQCLPAGSPTRPACLNLSLLSQDQPRDSTSLYHPLPSSSVSIPLPLSFPLVLPPCTWGSCSFIANWTFHSEKNNYSLEGRGLPRNADMTHNVTLPLKNRAKEQVQREKWMNGKTGWEHGVVISEQRIR